MRSLMIVICHKQIRISRPFHFILICFSFVLDMNVDTILSEILPPTFRTSFGWRNEILPSNQQTQILHSAGTNGIHQNQFNMIHSGFGNVRKNQSNFVQSGFGGIRQNQSNFVQEQKLSEQEIIKRVEQGQIPPVIVRRKLPNNLVTYQQNVSVRYLQPPPLPPPGPLIIRKNLFSSH